MGEKIIDYSKIDSIIKKNLDITWQNFLKEYNGRKISSYSFYVRRAELAGRKLPDQRRIKSSKNGNGKINLSAAEIVSKIMPRTKKRKKDFIIVAEALLKDSNTVFNEIAKEHKLKIQPSPFYKFRKGFQKLIKSQNVSDSEKPETKTSYRRKGSCLFTRLAEIDVDSVKTPQEALQTLIDELNDKPQLVRDTAGQFEIREIVKPKHVFEIVSHTK